MRASDSSIGDAVASITWKSPSIRRRPSRTNAHNHKRSDSYLSPHPGMPSRHPLHQHRRIIGPPKISGKGGAQTEASSPSEKATPFSHPNQGPVQEHNNLGRSKRFSGRYKIAFMGILSLPLSFLTLCPFSCKSANDLSM